MDFKIYLQCDVVDSNGVLVLKQPTVPSNSLVSNFMKFQYANLSYYSQAKALDTSGTSRSISYGTILYMHATSATKTWGPVCGTSDTPVTYEDYVLGAHVTSNWTYGNTTVSLNDGGTNWNITVVRSFTNATGGTVTLNEFGLYGYSGSYAFLLDRTVHAVELANTEATTVTWTLTLSL